jgi:hypothetical protein
LFAVFAGFCPNIGQSCPSSEGANTRTAPDRRVLQKFSKVTNLRSSDQAWAKPT